MMRSILFLTGAVAVLSACGRASDASHVATLTESIKSKTFSGLSGERPCSIEVSWSERGIAELSIRADGLERYAIASLRSDQLDFVDNFDAFDRWMQQSDYGRRHQASGHSPFLVLDRKSHLFTRGVTYSAQISWYVGESIAFPAPSTKLVLQQDLELYGDLDTSRDEVELESFELKQRVKDEEVPLPVGSTKMSCTGLTAGL
jgi:hypothetical protein